jgi:transcription factor SPN1
MAGKIKLRLDRQPVLEKPDDEPTAPAGDELAAPADDELAAPVDDELAAPVDDEAQAPPTPGEDEGDEDQTDQPEGEVPWKQDVTERLDRIERTLKRRSRSPAPSDRPAGPPGPRREPEVPGRDERRRQQRQRRLRLSLR